jgi:PTH1 family peptidyl-tRNA hydrolase
LRPRKRRLLREKRKRKKPRRKRNKSRSELEYGLSIQKFFGRSTPPELVPAGPPMTDTESFDVGADALVVGLGNPGREYLRTRHNLGYMLLDKLIDAFEARLGPGKGEYSVGKGVYLGKNVYLVRPLTYMNESGIAVSDAVAKHRVPLSDMLVVCDDCELPFGMTRLRAKGSDGGHRGLESIIYRLKTEEFPRLRIGIGKVPAADLTDYVLTDFLPEERGRLPEVLTEAERAAKLFLELGIDKAMSMVNRRVEVE